MSDVDDLVTWLRVQLDDDERVALAAGGENWPDSAHEMWTNELVHARRHDPARVLAEVDAKRRIVRCWPDPTGQWTAAEADAARAVKERIYRLLALPYADRPGYRDEWKLDA